MQETGDRGMNNFRNWMHSKNAGWAHFFMSWIRNPSFMLVIISNVAVLFLPGFNILTKPVTFLWIYLVQSLMIGFVHMFKLFFYSFSAPRGPRDWRNPRAIAIFFMVHYGFFHFVYSFFIPPSNADWNLVFQGALVFAFALIINTIRHYRTENSGRYNANDFMFLPYVRIIPIHIAIILGGFISAMAGSFAGVAIVLVILKTSMELFLEYLQQLGISFAELQGIANQDEKPG